LLTVSNPIAALQTDATHPFKPAAIIVNAID
jgi:hypothetical protein